VGKSLFVIQMAVDLALGRTFLGQYGVPEPAKVVYIQGEISDDQIEARLEAMKRGLSPAETQCLHERLLLLNTTDLKLSNPVDVEELVRMVAEVGDVRVLIIDPLIKFHSLEENSASEMQRLFDALDQLRSRLKVSVVIVHHHGHGRQDRDGATRLRGSTALFGYVDSALSLEAVGKGGAVRLTFELRNGANPDPVVLSRDMDTLCYAVEDGDANKKVTRRHIISCLEASGEEVPRKDLISMLSRTCKASHATVETAIKAAEDQHLIDCREGSGRGKPKFYRSLN
jgi:DNA-binding transcriptional ArsR family regulator